MQPCWYLYGFDYERYLELRPRLRSAGTMQALLVLAEGLPDRFDSEILESLCAAMAADGFSLTGAKNALLVELCCAGEALPLDESFAGLAAMLARRKGSEEAGERLLALLAEQHNVEDWFRVGADESGLRGFLTPDEMHELRARLVPLLARPNPLSAPRRKRRRGGLVGWLRRPLTACRDFGRSLLNLGPLPDETLLLLDDLLNETARHHRGLVLVAP